MYCLLNKKVCFNLAKSLAMPSNNKSTKILEFITKTQPRSMVTNLLIPYQLNFEYF